MPRSFSGPLDLPCPDSTRCFVFFLKMKNNACEALIGRVVVGDGLGVGVGGVGCLDQNSEVMTEHITRTRLMKTHIYIYKKYLFLLFLFTSRCKCGSQNVECFVYCVLKLRNYFEY